MRELALGAGFEAVREKLGCGAECGSCIPEVKRLAGSVLAGAALSGATAASATPALGATVLSIKETA